MQPIMPEHFPWKDYKKYTYPLGLDFGEFAILSGHSASEYDPQLEKVVAKGGIEQQLRTAFEKIAVVLEAARYGLGDIVSMVQYVTPGALGSLPVLEEVAQGLGVPRGVACTVPVTRLMRRDALVELEVIAARPGSGLPSLIHVGIDTHSGPENDADAEGPLSAGVVAMLSGLPSGADSILTGYVLATPSTGAPLEGIRDASVSQLAAAAHLGYAVVPELRQGAASGNIGAAFVATTETECDESWTLSGGETLRRFGPLLVATGILGGTGRDGIVAEAEHLYRDKVPALLGIAGLGMEALARTTEWLPLSELGNYRATAATREQYLSQPYPVAAGLVCESLPRNASLAVDLIAVDPRHR